MKATNGVDVTSVLSCVLDECPGESVALRAGDQLTDYDTLADGSHYLADVLGEAGVQGGCRVGLLITGGIRSVIALCALGRLAATVVMLDAAALPRDVAARIRDADVELLVADHSADDLLDDIVHELGAEDLPIAVTPDYALAGVAPARWRPDRSPRLVFFDDAQSSSRTWNEMLDPSAALRCGVAGGSTVAIIESLLRPHSVAALFAAFAAGAQVALTGRLAAPVGCRPRRSSWTAHIPIERRRCCARHRRPATPRRGRATLLHEFRWNCPGTHFDKDNDDG